MPEGFSRVERAYDAYGNVIEECWYDAEGKPTTTSYGYFRGVFTRDSRGHTIREDLYQNPVAPKKFIRHVLEWDVYGNVTREEIYDDTGMPWNAGYSGEANLYEYDYDAQGNRVFIKACHVDASGVVRCIWQEQMVYDAQGNLIQTERIDGDEE